MKRSVLFIALAVVHIQAQTQTITYSYQKTGYNICGVRRPFSKAADACKVDEHIYPFGKDAQERDHCYISKTDVKALQSYLDGLYKTIQDQSEYEWKPEALKEENFGCPGVKQDGGLSSCQDYCSKHKDCKGFYISPIDKDKNKDILRCTPVKNTECEKHKSDETGYHDYADTFCYKRTEIVTTTDKDNDKDNDKDTSSTTSQATKNTTSPTSAPTMENSPADSDSDYVVTVLFGLAGMSLFAASIICIYAFCRSKQKSKAREQDNFGSGVPAGEVALNRINS